MRISEKRRRGLTIGNPFRVLSCQAESAVNGMDYDRCRLQVFQKRIGDISSAVVRYPRRLAFHVLHQAVQIVARIGNTNHSQSGMVPQSAGVQLGNGNVEMGAQSVFQAAHNLPLVLERLRCFDAQFEGKKGDHSVVGRWSLVVGKPLVTLTTNNKRRTTFYAIASAATFSVAK